jgi:hypothetical protein
MPTSLIALQILLILLPGFAAAYVVQILALRNNQTDFDKAIEACLYSFVIYSVFVLSFSGTLPFGLVAAKPPATEAVVTWYPSRLAALAAITLFIALAATAYINLDGNRIFRRFRLTERTTRRSIWNDILEKEAKPIQIVQVELADGRSILGLLTYYSDSADDCSVYIEQACWVDSAGSETPIPGPGILLTKNAAIKSISLLNPAS